jgi:hypothetical protein
MPLDLLPFVVNLPQLGAAEPSVSEQLPALVLGYATAIESISSLQARDPYLLRCQQ